LFSIRDSTGAQADRLCQRALERRYLTMGGPELQLGVARCAKFDEVLLAAVVQFDTRDHLRVAAVERFGEPQNRGQRTNRPARLRVQRAEVRL
jgi:hypothetical protein